MKKTFKLLIMTAALLFALLPAVSASEFAYTIDNVTLSDAYGESFSDDDGICVVTAEVTKNKETTGKDRVWFAGYNADGHLLNAEYTDISIKVGETGYEVVELISSPEKIDKVSVFIWNIDGSITPLAENVTKEAEKEYTNCYYAPELFYNITESEITFRIDENSSNTIRYNFSPMGAELYVNGLYYTGISSYSISEVSNIIASAYGDIRLILDGSQRIEKIVVEYRIYARINQYVETSDTHTITLSTMVFPGNVTNASVAKNIVKISKDDIECGYIKVNSERNGVKNNLSELRTGDVVSIKYDISGAIEYSEFIDISATDKTISAKYISYDSEKEGYTLLDSALGVRNEYKSVRDFSYQLENGRQYEFTFAPDGRLYDYELIADCYTFAIIENYVDINEVFTPSEYSYIDVMTLDGQVKTLYIETSYDSKARSVLSKMGIDATSAQALYDIPIQNRIVEYILNEEGRVSKIINTSSGYDVVVCEEAEYNSYANKLGLKTLSPSCRVLDATEYTKKLQSGYAPTAKDYKASSIASLKDSVTYDAILVLKSNAEYYNAIITATDAGILNGDSNFTVAAANFKTSSKAIVNDEDVYTLDVMEDGSSDAAKLNISMNAKAYINGSLTELTDIKAGTIFFYTTDTDGFVDRISIVYHTPDSYEGIVGMTTENMLKSIYLPYLGDDNTIRANDWLVSLNQRDFDSSAKEEIQLMTAVVVQDFARGISVAPIQYDENKKVHYIDTNNVYDFSFAGDERIYSYDMSGDTMGTSRFSSGQFNGISLHQCDDDGRAWLGDVGDNFNLTDMIQPAFIMVVDGAVTNALVFTN